MNDDLGYGPRLTDAEYDRRVIELQRNLPPVPSRSQEQWVRRRELNLAIDHRLGCDFPRSKREALWAIQERVDKKRGRLIFKYLLRKFYAKRLGQDAQRLGGYLVSEYAKVLSQSELEHFFGHEEVHRPTLPVDREHLN